MGLMPEQNRAVRIPLKIILVKIINVCVLLYFGFCGAGRIAAGAGRDESGTTGLSPGHS
jgi:hypothetical protein